MTNLPKPVEEFLKTVKQTSRKFQSVPVHAPDKIEQFDEYELWKGIVITFLTHPDSPYRKLIETAKIAQRLLPLDKLGREIRAELEQDLRDLEVEK